MGLARASACKAPAVHARAGSRERISLSPVPCRSNSGRLAPWHAVCPCRPCAQVLGPMPRGTLRELVLTNNRLSDLPQVPPPVVSRVHAYFWALGVAGWQRERAPRAPCALLRASSKPDRARLPFGDRAFPPRPPRASLPPTPRTPRARTGPVKIAQPHHAGAGPQFLPAHTGRRVGPSSEFVAIACRRLQQQRRLLFLPSRRVVCGGCSRTAMRHAGPRPGRAAALPAPPRRSGAAQLMRLRGAHPPALVQSPAACRAWRC
jgi:hypothetical protein